MKEVGTLKELDVKPGDVFYMHDLNREYTVAENAHVNPSEVKTTVGFHYDWRMATIISRANTQKLWRDMTDAEKGALLLAKHEGKVIEGRNETWKSDEWVTEHTQSWYNNAAYRIRPEPKVATHTHIVFAHGEIRGTKYNTIDGKVDWSSFEVMDK